MGQQWRFRRIDILPLLMILAWGGWKAVASEDVRESRDSFQLSDSAQEDLMEFVRDSSGSFRNKAIHANVDSNKKCEDCHTDSEILSWMPSDPKDFRIDMKNDAIIIIAMRRCISRHQTTEEQTPEFDAVTRCIQNVRSELERNLPAPISSRPPETE